MYSNDKPYSEIIEILKSKDSILKKAIETIEEYPEPAPSIDIYYDLLNSIVSQQLSVKVAAIIWKRFIDLFPDQYPNERILIDTPDSELRAIGLSRQKLSYLKNVAQFSLESGMGFEKLNELSDQEIITYLTAIKGVGKWTVQMVLMFPMDRADVFPIDDLGIETKIISYYKLKVKKEANGKVSSAVRKDLRNKMTSIADQWKPYRSLACKMLWKADSI